MLLLLRASWDGYDAVRTGVGRCVQVVRSYYFSTHGCMRLDSCLVVGAFDELAFAAACCRAFTLKKSAIVAVALRLYWSLDVEQLDS